jgi:hypothetical protein
MQSQPCKTRNTSDIVQRKLKSRIFVKFTSCSFLGWGEFFYSEIQRRILCLYPSYLGSSNLDGIRATGASTSMEMLKAFSTFGENSSRL